MEISRHNLEGARILLSDVEQHMGVVFDRITMTEVGSMTEKVYTMIHTSPEHMLSRPELLKKLSHRINALELSKIIETLAQSRRIKQETFEGKLYYIAKEF